MLEFATSHRLRNSIVWLGAWCWFVGIAAAYGQGTTAASVSPTPDPEAAKRTVSATALNGPGINYEPGLSFAIPVSNGASNEFELWISSRSGTLTLESTEIHAHFPDGAIMPANSLRVDAGTALLTEAGLPLRLTPQMQNFQGPGSYKILLNFHLRTADQRIVPVQSVPFTFERSVPDLSTAQVTDLTRRLYRRPLGGAARGEITFHLAEVGGRTPVEKLDIVPGKLLSVVAGSTNQKEEVPAALTVRRASAGTALPTTIGAGGGDDFVFSLDEIHRTGAFSVELTLRSPSFQGGSKTIPLHIEVKDDWLLPMFVIFVGVGASFWMRYSLGTQQPRAMLLYRIEQATLDWRDTNARLLHEDKKTRSLVVQKALIDAERLAIEGDFAGAQVKLNLATQQLGALQATESTDRENTRGQIKTLRAQVDKYREWLGDSEAVAAARLEYADESLGKLSAMLDEGQVDAATDGLPDIQSTVNATIAPVLQARINDALSEFHGLGAVPANLSADAAKVETALTQARDSAFAEDKVPEAWSGFVVAFQELQALISDVQRQSGQIATRLMQPMMQQNLSEVETENQPENASINILNKEGCTTESFVVFKVEGDDEIESFIWYFKDGSTPAQGGRSVSHLFSRRDTYQVEAVPMVNGNAGVPLLAPPLVIVDGPAQQAVDRFLARAKREQLACSLFSLVVACALGWAAVYVKSSTFGSVEDYIFAFLWGLGVDSTTHTIADLKKSFPSISSPAASPGNG